MFARNELGRSMIEIICVIAIIGVISLATFNQIKYLMYKNTANKLLTDAQLAYAEEYDKTPQFDTDWENISFTTESAKQLLTRYDLQGQIYVLVLSVEKGVCDLLLKQQKDGELAFFDEDETPKTQCQEQNNIIFAFNGQGLPIECTTTADCGDDFIGYCNKIGRCTECNADQVVNSYRTACLCDETEYTTCSDEINTWCCPNDQLCGIHAGENQCLISDRQCSGYFTTTQATGDIKYYTDCEATFIAGRTLTKVSGIETTETIFTITKDCTKLGEYCNIFWTADNWDLTATAPTINTETTQTTLYGKCRPFNTNSTSLVPSMGDNTLPTTTFSENKKCPQKQYCSIQWSKNTCSSSLGHPEGALWYGVCVDGNQNYGTCPY